MINLPISNKFDHEVIVSIHQLLSRKSDLAIMEESKKEKYELYDQICFLNSKNEKSFTWFIGISDFIDQKNSQRKIKQSNLDKLDIGVLNLIEIKDDIINEVSLSLPATAICVVLADDYLADYLDNYPSNIVLVKREDFSAQIEEYEDRIFWEIAEDNLLRFTDETIFLCRVFRTKEREKNYLSDCQADLIISADDQVIVDCIKAELQSIKCENFEELQALLSLKPINYDTEKLIHDIDIIENELKISTSLVLSNEQKKTITSEKSSLNYCSIFDQDVEKNTKYIVEETDDIVETVLRYRSYEATNSKSLKTLIHKYVINAKEVSLADRAMCLVPFINATFNPDRYHICCMEYSENDTTKYTDLDSFWNSERIKEVRLGLLTNKPAKTCLGCIEQGVSMVRQNSLKDYFNDHEREEIQISGNGYLLNKPSRMLVALSNKCNLACKMCSSHYSTTFDSSAFKIGLHESKKGEVSISDTDYQIIGEIASSLKYINVTGGDAFYDSERFNKLLDVLRPYAQYIHILINVNGHFFDSSCIEKLKKFNCIDIVFSIDGERESCTKLRTFHNRDRVIKNVLSIRKFFSDYPRLKIGCHAAIGNLNILSLPKFSTEIIEEFQNSFDYISIGMINAPSYYAAWNVPINERESILNQLIEGLKFIDKRLKPEMYDIFYHFQNKLIEEMRRTRPTQADNDSHERVEKLWSALIPVKTIS